MTGHDLMSAMPMIVWEIRRHGAQVRWSMSVAAMLQITQMMG